MNAEVEAVARAICRAIYGITVAGDELFDVDGESRKESAHAARAAIAALDGLRGWRPIETAPKTAEYVLMARSGDNLFGVGAVGPTEVVWDWPWARPPTHWMPLPPAPEDAP